MRCTTAQCRARAGGGAAEQQGFPQRRGLSVVMLRQRLTLFSALLLASGAAAQTTVQLSAECASDFSALSRGTQTEGSPPNFYWRTGNPKQVTTATLGAGLAAGAVVDSLSFSYQYLAGYGPGGATPNISLQLAGSVLYSSGALDAAYNYSVPPNHTGYSPPVAVKASGLPLTMPAAGGAIELVVSNNARNLQILLPLTFTVTCKSPGPCAAATAWKAPTPVVVFRGGDKGPAGTDETNTTGNCFRIPQIATAPDGELLAFAEGRYASCWPDVRPENRIVMRRSIDGGVGQAWAPIQVLWGKTAAERLKGLNYPMPLVDAKTGTVSLFFYQDGCGPPCPKGQKCPGCPVWRVNSTDSGKTWSSPPTNMSTVKGWVGASGGGKGLQLPSGRLVFACGGKACWSDDHGASWQNGTTAPLGPGVGGFGEESIVADGRTPNSLAMFIRSGSKGGGQAGARGSPLINHAVASSLDGGASWGPARLLPSVIGVTCQGSVGAAGGAKVANGQLLLSAPYSRDLSGYGQNGRENMAVWTYRLNATNTGPTGPDPEPELVARLWPCKAACKCSRSPFASSSEALQRSGCTDSAFSEDGRMNLFEGGPTMRYQTIMLATLNHTFPSPN